MLGTGDDAEQDGGAAATRFAANEQGVLPQECRKLNHAFGEIVIDRQCAVFGIATERFPLIQSIRERPADLAFGKDVWLHLLEPRFKGIQDRNRVLLPRGA